MKEKKSVNGFWDCKQAGEWTTSEESEKLRGLTPTDVHKTAIFRGVGNTTKSAHELRHVFVCPSARTHGTTRFPLEGFS